MAVCGKRAWFAVVMSCGVLASSNVAWTQARPPAVTTKLEVAPGTKAIYRVREQLARLNFPNDAVGTTESVTGAVVIRPDGSIAADSSKLTVDLRTLKTDEDRRDNFVRENTLETKRFPLAEFVPRRQMGLPTPLPSSGTATFQLIGDMLLHGVTAETAWDVTATFAPDAVTGKAATKFNFAKFKITVPKVFGLLSVDDEIRLELEVRLRRVAAS